MSEQASTALHTGRGRPGSGPTLERRRAIDGGRPMVSSATPSPGRQQDTARSGAAALPRAMNVTPAYWYAMLAASALGTNIGDLWAEILFPGAVTSLASLLIICAAAVWLIAARPHEPT